MFGTLRPITWDDYDLYRSFFRAASETAVYANSWTYITQACRGFGLGLKYSDADRLFSVGRHKGHYVVVNPLGAADGRLLDLIDMLRRRSGKPVFVKKASGAHAALLRQFGALPALRDGYAWDAVASADDDTYPELIVDPEVSLGYSLHLRDWFQQYREVRNGAGVAEGDSVRACYRQFRRYLRVFSTSDTACDIVEFSPAMLPALETLVESYFGGERPEAARVYDNLLAGLRRGIRPGSEFCFVVRTDRRDAIDGLIFAERLDSCSAAVYARLVRRSSPGLPEYAMAQVLSRLKQEGIRRLNLGGSETPGLHVFKRKLAPIEERTLPLLVCGHDAAR